MLALNEVMLPRINRRQLRSLVIAMGISFTLLASQVTDVLAQGTNPPTPEPVKVGDVTFSFKQMKGGAIQVSAPAYLNPTIKGKQPPAPDLEGMTKAYDRTYGPIIGSIFDCAQAIAKLTDNKGYLEPPEWSTTSKNVLKRKPIISTSNITIDPLAKAENGTQPCAPKGKQVISTLLPTITAIPPSKIPPTTSPTKAQSSSTPVQPTSTSTPQAEVPISPDLIGEYIQYGIWSAFVLALLGFGYSLFVSGNKNDKKSSSVVLRHLPRETVVKDPSVVYISDEQGRPFKAHVGESEDDLPVTFHPQVIVVDPQNANLLQRVANSLARGWRQRDKSIDRGGAALLAHHEMGHVKGTKSGAVIGSLRNSSGKMIGAGVKNVNPDASSKEQIEMFLGPDDPSAHDIKNAGRADEEIKKRKK